MATNSRICTVYACFCCFIVSNERGICVFGPPQVCGGGRALVIAHHPFLGHLKTGHQIYPFISALFTRPFMNISAPTCLRSPKMWNFINILKRKGLGMWVRSLWLSDISLHVNSRVYTLEFAGSYMYECKQTVINIPFGDRILRPEAELCSSLYPSVRPSFVCAIEHSDFLYIHTLLLKF